MEHLFDPDDVDLSDDPEYLKLISYAGPLNNTHWAEGKAALAKRAEMLEIDREMSTAWMRAMEKMLLMELSDAEFTAQRMLRLRGWTKERKRRQHNLHYKYDPTRRNPRLVERDTSRQLQSIGARLQAIQERIRDRHPGIAERVALPAQSSPVDRATAPVRTADRLPAPRARPSRQLRDEAFIPAPGDAPATIAESATGGPPPPFIPEYLTPATFEMIVKDTGLRDPARATDEAIVAAYERAQMGGYPAEYFLALLRGRTPPPHPDDAEDDQA